MGLEVRAFGPMEVVRGGAGVRIGSRQQQRLLAMLLLRQGGVVSGSALAELLWPDDPSASVANRLRIQVHRLRRLLGDRDAVQLRRPGYALVLPRAAVDLYQFEELAQRGRAALVSGDRPAAARWFRQAVELHRGPAFQGLDDVVELAIESRRLDELRLAVIEDRITAELALGAPTELVSELDALVASYPLRERFRAQLMTALYRVGRKADALASYRAGRRLLVEELGMEPSEECQALERAILADDPALSGAPAGPPAPGAGPAPPRQLPPDLPAFTGRERQLRALDEQLRPPGTAVISAVEGMAGVGKTALALRWAHRAAEWFPDGQLYVDLRGYAPGAPLRPQQVLERFLRSLGVPDGRIPADPEEAAAAYRSLLAGRRVLVLLDNAADPEQVRPLLPGGDGCVALVTSRSRLAGLVARDGAVGLALGVLPDREATALLVRVLGAGPVAAEPAAASELVRLCAGLPLALRIAAANLASRPALTVAGYLAQLRGADRLAALAVAGDEPAAVRAAFDLSYRRLAGPARRAFRRIGLVPGPEVTAAAVAALAGTDPVDGGRQLATLAAAHLVEEQHPPDRYRCHDLLRAYARELVQTEEPAGEAEIARNRLHRYYRAGAEAADRLAYPQQLRPEPAHPEPAHPEPASPDAGVPPAGFADAAAARRWLDAEWPQLVAVVQLAATNREPVAWQLGVALRGYIMQRVYAADGEAVVECAGSAAAAAGPPEAYGLLLLCLAGLRFRQGRGQQAIDHLAGALAAFRAGGWAEGEGAVLSNLGAVNLQLGRPHDAIRCYTEARALFRAIRSGPEPPAPVTNLGMALVDLGRLREAADHAQRTAAALTDAGLAEPGLLSTAILGLVHRLRGEFGPALRCYAHCLSRYREFGDPAGESTALRGLAEVHCDTGGSVAALELAGAALRLAREIGHDLEEAEALPVLARIHHQRGDLPAADRDSGRALALARRIGNRVLTADSLLGRALVHRSAGAYPPAFGCLDEALRIARAGALRLVEGRTLTTSAVIALAAGDLERAVDDGERALAIHRETGHRPGEAATHALLGQARHRGGAGPAARDHDRHARRLLAGMGVQLGPAGPSGAGEVGSLPDPGGRLVTG